jgi:hypothetical protein
MHQVVQGRAGIDPSLPKSINSTAAPRTLLWSVPKVNTVKVSFCSKASPSRCDAERAKLGKEADSAGPKKLTLPYLSFPLRSTCPSFSGLSNHTVFQPALNRTATRYIY